ncbi:MAG: T9SS type A sorting domain-containing protein [Balneolaceae bacterium]
MEHKYKLITLASLIGAFFLMPLNSVAQEHTTCPTDQAECVVAWHDGSGDFQPIPNALRNTIANDTLRPENRVYVLETGGAYLIVDEILNEGFHLHLRGQTPEEVDNYFGPAKIQLTPDSEGNSAGRLITAQGDLTLENIWFSGQLTSGSTGNYLPIRMSSGGARLVVDNCVFERSDFSLFGFDSSNNKVYITNSRFRNHINRTQQWEGRGLRFEGGADTLIVENTTFMNFGHTVIQSEAAPINYVRFVHNTVINVGRTFNSGNFWLEAYVANNLHINHYWHGEGDADGINDDPPSREYPYTGYIGVAPLNPSFGLDNARRIVISNNAHWRDPQFADYYSDTLNAQPVFNAQTDSMFTTFDVSTESGSMYRANNWVGDDPVMESYKNAPDLGSNFPETEISLEENVPIQIANIRDLREARQSPFTDWTWDPGRNPAPSTYSLQPVMWPLPEDLSYTNSTYLTAGTDGLPLGDLNWQDGSAMDDWLANKDTYVSEIEALAGAIVDLVVVGSAEAEDGTLGGDSQEDVFDGFAYFFMESSGFIEWEFDVETAGTYDLNVLTHLEGNGVRGQRVILTNDTYPNGLSLKDCLNYGEYIWDADGGQGDGCNPHVGMATDEWVWTRINNSEMHSSTENGLVLPTGAHKLRLEPSWGFQSFSTIQVLEEGTETVAVELSPTEANYGLVSPNGLVPDQDGEPAPWVASGFKSVELGSSGTVSVDIEFPGDGTYLIRGFYNSAADGTMDVEVGGEPVGSVDILADEEGGDFLTAEFEASAGVHTITISGSNARVDYVQLIEKRLSTSIERPNGLPEGYELSQNYPNPFNPTTKINYTIPQATNVELTVFNILGQKVATLVDTRQFAGSHTVNFDARNLASGIYFYRLKAGEVVHQRKMTLIK